MMIQEFKAQERKNQPLPNLGIRGRELGGGGQLKVTRFTHPCTASALSFVPDTIGGKWRATVRTSKSSPNNHCNAVQNKMGTLKKH